MSTFSNAVTGFYDAVEGVAEGGMGVIGVSATSTGVRGVSSTAGRGVEGWSTTGEGVHGMSTDGTGVLGNSGTAAGVSGVSVAGPGVVGESRSSEGARGVSHGQQAGVVGINDAAEAGGNGGWFESTGGEGVRGWSKNPGHGGVVGVNTSGGTAVHGTSDRGAGVWGTSVDNEGVHAETRSGVMSAVAAHQTNAASNSAALYAKHHGGRTAAFLDGDLVVTGDIQLTGGADLAEEFDLGAGTSDEPGTVMVVGDDSALHASCGAYDRRVAGVVSGAGSYRPGVVLDRQGRRDDRTAIALLGKVFCKVDTTFGPIAIGDLLTTSPTPGHAMRADDPARAFGAVIGKALRPLSDGRGVIPILIALQ